MKTTIQKTAIILFVVMSIGLVSGNPLFAQDQESVGLINAADLAFIQAEPRGIRTSVANLSRGQNISLISSADLAFVSQPFVNPVRGYSVNSGPVGVGLITAADYHFITGGEVTDIFTAYNDLSDSLAGGLAE